MTHGYQFAIACVQFNLKKKIIKKFNDLPIN